MRMGWFVVGALTLALVGGFTECRAQESATLERVETLMAEGRILQARQTLEAWWARVGPDASRTEWQRSIWLRGRLTVDPAMAELDYRRLVLEYPGGPYSDDALYRLGQLAQARGDLRETQSHFQMLVRDYPSSPRSPEAERWLREHADEIAALQDVAPVVERAPPEDPAEPGVGDFSVQVGAFRSLERARDLARRIGESGYRARLVRTPGTELARVRVGRFSSRDEAEALGRTLEGLGFDHTLVSDAGSEERIGDGRTPQGEDLVGAVETPPMGP
jgi:hypothetical protein